MKFVAPLVQQRSNTSIFDRNKYKNETEIERQGKKRELKRNNDDDDDDDDHHYCHHKN